MARTRAFLDLQEGRGPVRLLDDAGIEVILRWTRRIAVIGASSDPGRPSYGVFRYLLDNDFECVPVNPNETEVLGVPAFDTLAAAVEATGPFDMVDVFRRSELCVPHAEEAVEAGAALSLAPARGRELGGGRDRRERRAVGRDGPLYRDRVAAPGRTPLGETVRAGTPASRRP